MGCDALVLQERLKQSDHTIPLPSTNSVLFSAATSAATPDAAVAGRPPYHADEPPKFAGCFDNEKIAFVEYHHILPVFNLNDFNWTQTPSAVDDKTVETIRGVVPSEKIVVFRFGTDDSEIKAFIVRNFTSGDAPALATPIDRNNFSSTRSGAAR